MECLEHHVEYVCSLKSLFIHLLQIYQLQGELHSTGSWRRGKIGRHFGTKYWKKNFKKKLLVPYVCVNLAADVSKKLVQ
jgi:uncharacterized membrane protein